MDDYKRLKGLDNFEVLVHSVLEFGMGNINNLKVKDLRVLLCYHFGSEKLKGSPNKVELVGAVKYFFRKDWDFLVYRWGVDCLLKK